MNEKTHMPLLSEKLGASPKAQTNRPHPGETVFWEGGPKVKLNLLGLRFGRWIVIATAKSSTGGQARWLCRCDCGTEKIIPSLTLREHQSQSCGCWNREATAIRATTHGKSRTKTYAIWKNMLDRCRNPKAKSFKDYGARGIKVCDRWLTFENFLADTGEQPKGHWIERKNNSDGYCPDNCMWTTPKQQANNRRNSRLVVLDGIKDTILAHSIRLGVPYHVVYYKIGRGAVKIF